MKQEIVNMATIPVTFGDLDSPVRGYFAELKNLW